LLLQSMQLQQHRMAANNQQIMANLAQNVAIGASQQPTPSQLNQLQISQQLQSQRVGDNPNALNPNRMIPQESNPHNFPIPLDSQKRLVAIGVPSDKLVSWKEVIHWLQEAYKGQRINEEQYGKVKTEYYQVATAINSNPRAFFLQQVQLRNAGGLQAQHQQLMNPILGRTAIPGQQQPVNPQQSLQTAQQAMPPQAQLNLSGLQQMPQQIPAPQAAVPAQAVQQQQQQQPQLQQQQQHQIHAAQAAQVAQVAQQRKTRAPAKKPPARKGQDAANPMVIGNTPTPTNVPTPSPAQLPASLPTTTPINVASPAGMHLPGSTPIGISPAETHTVPTPKQIEVPQSAETARDQLQALQFINTESEKIRGQLMTYFANQQPKNLTQEEKVEMRTLLGGKSQECINHIEKLAPLLYVITKDEGRITSLLRLVAVRF